MDISNYVGPAIRALREQAGYSQEELADRAQLDRTYVSGIERGRRNPSVKSLQRVAAALDTSLDVLFIQARTLADADPQRATSKQTRRVRSGRGPFLAHSFAIDLRGTLWRVRLPRVFGTITVFVDPDLSQGRGTGGGFNILGAIDDFTQAYASRLRPMDAQCVLDASLIGFTAITFLGGLRGDTLGEQAGLDYEHSVDALMTGFSWSKASWETAQCAEKVMKTVLIRAGCKHIPKGRDGHDIPSLGHLLEREGSVSLDADDLGLIHCDPKVRYGEEVVNPEAAYEAHRALLRLLKTLSDQLGMSEYA